MPITLSANQWTPIGPAPVVSGPFAGRIDVAAPDPNNPNVMYLGANNGGIWKTTNWLDTTPIWTPLTDLPQIRSLAIHEHDLVVFPGSSNLVLAAASGPGGGILRSEDGGNTWSFLANSNFNLAEFGALVVDPNVGNAQTLYVAISAGLTSFASGSGLYKSTDGGATWADAGAGVFSGFVSDLLEIQENGQTVLYAGDVGNGQAGSGGIYRNDGSGWHKTNLPTIPNGILCMRLAGGTVPVEKIYASIIDNAAVTVISRFVTSNQGGTWVALTWPDAPTGSGPHRYRHNLLAVDPANSSNVYVNTDLENNLVHNLQEFVYLSGDGGQTWKAALDGGGDPASGGFDGAGVFFVTSDGGIHHDPVNNIPAKANKGGNLNTIEFYAFSLDPSNPQAGYGLFQDGPGVLIYGGAPDWSYTQPPHIAFGESGKARVDPTNSGRVYYLDPNTADPASSPTAAARFLHSDDGGKTWTAAITGLAQISGQVNNKPAIITDFASFPGKRSILIDPNNPKRLLLGLTSLFETTTGGDPNAADPKFSGNGWRDIGATMGNNGSRISAVALAPSDPNTVYAGTEDGHVFKTTNAGNASPSWTEVDSGLPLQGQRVMDLNIDPANPDHIFAVTCPFMQRDDNAPNFSDFFHVWVRNGAGWSQINGNLPTELGGEAIAVDWQAATPVLYLGTLRGAFKSTDLGASWSLMDGMPRTRVTDLDFMPNLGLIGAGTIGRGAWEIVTSSISFVIDKSTYSKDEFSLNPVAPAYWLQVAGFTNAQLNLNNTGDLSDNPPNPAPVITVTFDPSLNPTLMAGQLPTISANLPSVAQFGPVPIVPTDPNFAQNPQTFLYPYTVSFSSNAAFGALLPDQSAILTLNATLTAGQITRTASANIELIAGENPYFEDVDLLHPAAFPFWLSFDLRFFKMTVPSKGPVQTASRFNAKMTTHPADAPGFIAAVIGNLTMGKGAVGTDSFEAGLSQVQKTSAVEFLPQDSSGNWVFNFAVARVRLKGNTAGAQAVKVRVFFRLFAAQTTATDFDPGTTYRFHSDSVLNGVTVPLLGVQNNEYVTIPCFATPRVNLTSPADMKTQPEDTPNAYTITVDPGVEVDSFFGCWLDVNRPDQKFLALTPVVGNLDGPFSGTPHSINEMITRAPHQCVIAEIRYDDAPIPTGATPADSDKLAQRNIAWINGPNPGAAASRKMPHPFDIIATSPGAAGFDQLMVMWGNVPAGSTATFYLPSLQAGQIVSLAEAIHGSNFLTAVDANTVECSTGGVTFIPIPKGTARNAGLLTIDLPPGIQRGDIYNVVVRQITVASATVLTPPPIQIGVSGAAVQTRSFSWNRLRGAFQITILISTKELLLVDEERLLAWLLWIKKFISVGNRWYPVFQRYVDQIAGRVLGFGGDPIRILPSPTSYVPRLGREHACEYTGKVDGVVYDRFGDFEGFVLLTEHGEEHLFRARECKIEELVRLALRARTLITVFAERHDPHRPVSIVLRG